VFAVAAAAPTLEVELADGSRSRFDLAGVATPGATWTLETWIGRAAAAVETVVTVPGRGTDATTRLVLQPVLLPEAGVTEADLAKYPLGSTLAVDAFFKTSELVDVIGTSKGRGFAGVMKRHHFKGFIQTHGTHEYFRHGGSIGTRLTPGMTLKGKKMPGHMGAEQVTVQNLRVAKVDAEKGLVFVNGGVPGPDGGDVIIRKSVKKNKK
jgi:50S ribosomal protein uL3